MRSTSWLLLLLLACGPGELDIDATPRHGGAGDDASLAALKVSNGSLEPAFDPARTLYAVDADEDVKLTATPTDPEATVELIRQTLAGEELERLPGPVQRVELVGGERWMAEVTSADGTAVRQTQLTVIPADFPRLDVWSSEPGPGYFFTTNMDFVPARAGLGRYRMILDNQGIPLWIQKMEGTDFDFRAGPGDTTTWIEMSAEGMAWKVREADGTIRSAPAPWDAMGDPHEFTLLEDGHTLVVGARLVPTDLTAWGGTSDVPVLAQTAQELDEEGNVVFEWDSAGQVDPDDLPPEILDFSAPEIELAHLNSIEIDPYDGDWVISLRLPSQVIKVDRSTGAIRWRLGGPGSDFAFVDDPRDLGWEGFAWQHSARVTGPDRVMVFDNAMTPTGPTGDSRYVEYQLDLDAMTATKVAEWSLEGAGMTGAAGSVQRMADGHTVLGFGSLIGLPDERAPQIVEVDADGNVVFELRLPEAEWSYRSWKFDRDETGWILP